MQLNTGPSFRYGVLVPITVSGDLGFIYLLKSRCSVLSELVFKIMYLWHLGIWFSGGLGCDGLKFGLSHLRSLFQSK